MTSRWAGLAIGLLLVVAGLSLGAAGCDPCASCSGHAQPSSSPTPAPNACLPSSSIGILVQGKNATAYLPQGCWTDGGCGAGTASVKVVPIETSSGIGTGGAPASITTGNVPNSCSSNSTTGETVCVGNNTDVYLINGTALTSTLTSGATSTEGFTGGTCENCGVVVDSSTNKALISIGLAVDDTSTGAFQFLDLGGTPTFETPIPAGGDTSEDISIDPVRHLVLSPNEASNYQLVNITTATPALFNNQLEDGEFDSAGEDCTTGIALSTIEFTGNLFIADLTQAVFPPGAPAGTWTDTGSQVVNFPEFTPGNETTGGLAAGTCGIAVAPGTHLAIVTGEYGGSLEGVVELPATSGSGTPAFVDYVAFTVPSPPAPEEGWSEGFDPHTVTAYVSPNSKKAYAVLENADFSYLAIVDLQGLLSAPRTGHVVNSPLPTGLVTFVAE